MEFGINYFPTHDGIDPGAMGALVEQRGYSALYVAEHTHIPAARATPYPPGGELPHSYSHTHDPFVALTAAAVRTSRIRLGTAVCLVAQRDPIITAKQVAGVDQLSGGRVDVGVGTGWNIEEMANHGVDPGSRTARMREHVEAMVRIWTQDEASYQGRFVSFDRIWCWPKPAAHPHPPVLVGGAGPTVIDRVLAFGDGWLATHPFTPDALDKAADLRARAERPMVLAVADVPADPAVLDRYARAGFARALHNPPAGPRGTVERHLDNWDTAIADFLGT